MIAEALVGERPVLSLARSGQPIGVSDQPIVNSDDAHSSIMHIVDCARVGMYRFSRLSGAHDACEGSCRCMSTVEYDSPGACKPDAGMTCDPMHDRLSGGNLEAVCPVPTVHRRSNSFALTVRDHFVDSGNSDGSQSPRRSAGSGPVEQCDHARRHVCMCADAYVRRCMLCRLRRTLMCETEWHAGGSAPIPAQARF